MKNSDTIMDVIIKILGYIFAWVALCIGMSYYFYDWTFAEIFVLPMVILMWIWWGLLWIWSSIF